MPGQTVLNRVITELFAPIMVLHPSLPKPMQLSRGIQFFSNTDITRLKITSALAKLSSLSSNKSTKEKKLLSTFCCFGLKNLTSTQVDFFDDMSVDSSVRMLNFDVFKSLISSSRALAPITLQAMAVVFFRFNCTPFKI